MQNSYRSDRDRIKRITWFTVGFAVPVAICAGFAFGYFICESNPDVQIYPTENTYEDRKANLFKGETDIVLMPDETEDNSCEEYARSDEKVESSPVSEGARDRYHVILCTDKETFLKSNEGLEFYVASDKFIVANSTLYLKEWNTRWAEPKEPRPTDGDLGRDVKITIEKGNIKAEGPYIDASIQIDSPEAHWLKIGTVKAVEIGLN